MIKLPQITLALLLSAFTLFASELVSARVQDQSISWVLGGFHTSTPELFTQYVEIEEQTVSIQAQLPQFKVRYVQGVFQFEEAVELQVFNVQGELLFKSSTPVNQWSPSEHGVSYSQLYLVYHNLNHSVQSSSWIQP